MANLRDAAFTLTDEMTALALEAATLLSTLEAGSTASEITRHADEIDAALPGLAHPLARKWMQATAASLRHAALYAATRPGLPPLSVAEMDGRMKAIADAQVAIVAAMSAGVR